jgi:hypothetical protein
MIIVIKNNNKNTVITNSLQLFKDLLLKYMFCQRNFFFSHNLEFFQVYHICNYQLIKYYPVPNMQIYNLAQYCGSHVSLVIGTKPKTEY